MNIDNYTFLEIDRKKGASAKLTVGLDDKTVKKLLIEALPLGNPEDGVFKLVTVGKDNYLSFLRLSNKEDYGLALVVSLSSGLNEINPLGLIAGMKELLSKCILDHGNNLPKNLDLAYEDPNVNLDKYENFDVFIFSLLTQQKTLVVGQNQDLESFLAGLLEFVPSKLKRYVTVIANSSNFTNQVYLHALPISDEILRIIDEKRGSHTILFLPTKVTYGKFSSPFCKKISELQKNNEEEAIEKELLQLFAKVIESNELPSIADFAAENGIALADASLILWMRANHYDLDVPKGIVEFTN